MTHLDNRKEPSQGPVGGSEAQEREAWQAAMRKLSDGEPDWSSPAALWSWATWQAARATAAAPAAPVRLDGMEPQAGDSIEYVASHMMRFARLDEAKARECAVIALTLLARDASEDAAHHPAAVVGQALEALERALAAAQAMWDKPKELRSTVHDLGPVAGHIRAAIAALSVQAGEVPAVVDAQPAEAERLWRAENALRNMEMACNYSPHRHSGTWDGGLAALIHQSARLLPMRATDSTTEGEKK